MKKRRVLAAMLAMTLALGATACGSSSSESTTAAPKATEAAKTETKAAAATTAAPAAPAEVKTLEFLWFSDGDEGIAMRKVLDKYEAEHPGIKVELLEVAGADYEEKLLMAISGGEPPALSRVNTAIKYKDVSLDLIDIFGSVEEYYDLYFDVIQGVDHYVVDGKINAIPGEASMVAMAYNKTLFDQAGVKVPQTMDEIWTWEEYLDALKTVKEKTGVRYGLALDRSGQRFVTVMYQHGAKMSDENGQPTFASEETKKTLERLKEMADSDLLMKSGWVGGEDPSNMFKAGQVATHIGGSWLLSDYGKNITDFEWGFTYMPKEVCNASVVTTKYFVGFQGSGVEEETKDLLKYLASKEAKSFYEDSLYIAPWKDTSDLVYEGVGDAFRILNDEAAMTSESSRWSTMNASIWTPLHPTIRDSVAEYLAGSKTVEEAMAAVDEKHAELLAEQ